jgi:hypothetical protein
MSEDEDVLESYSSRLLPCVQWEVIQKGNTPRFCTRASVKRLSGTCRTGLTFFATFDAFRVSIEHMFDMPKRPQNQGKLSNRAKDNEFA